MVKLFLVEDEIVMREGIKRQINWEKEDIEFVGEASDGELAWPMILDAKPDIVLTDIKMPFMDGLELSALIRKELPNTAIIILSGYDEFVYAQRAVSLGVTEYLLKPLPPGKLLECIRRVQEKIEQERSQTDSTWSDELAREQEDAGKNLLFRSLVTNDRPLKEILEMAEHLGIQISARYYTMMLMSVRGQDNAMPEDELRRELASILQQIQGWIFFDRNENGFAMIGMANSEEELEETRRKLIGSLREHVEKYTGHTWFIGAGRIVNRISDMEKAYYSANKAFSYRFITGLNHVAGLDENGPVRTEEELPGKGHAENGRGRRPDAEAPDAGVIPDLDVRDAVSDSNSREMLENYLRTGTLEEAEPFMEGVFRSVGGNNLKSRLFLNYLCMDLYFTMVRFLTSLGKNVDLIDRKCGDINTLLCSGKSAEEAREYLTSCLKEVILLRDHNTEKRYGKILREAVAFIDENYDQEEISLNRVAQTVGMSPNHFSSIFSQEMGTTFIEYLIGKRMERAKELLRTTQMRSSEIAYRVGYRDPHYFSSTFKKMQGMTPREYRTSCQ